MGGIVWKHGCIFTTADIPLCHTLDYIYRIYGKKKLDFFKDDFDVQTSVVINKKGLVHDTLGGYYE